MKNGKLLFRIKQDFQHRMRFGEVIDLYRACYFKGKELEYADGNVYFEWPEKVAYNSRYMYGDYYKCPSYTMLPIKFIKKEDVLLDDYEQILNLDEPNVFYGESNPIYKGKVISEQKKDYSGFFNYLNKYYFDTGQHPVFNLIKEKVEKPYILFHLRIAEYSIDRNPNLNEYKQVVEWVKERYGNKYEYWKCGEKCRGIDRMFDKVLDYFDELNDFIKAVNNATFCVCCASGPNGLMRGLGIPTLEIESEKFTRHGGPGVFIDGYLQRMGGITIGKNIFDWADKNKIKAFLKGDKINKIEMFEFTDKWL